jgi:hypothetical protein
MISRRVKRLCLLLGSSGLGAPRNLALHNQIPFALSFVEGLLLSEITLREPQGDRDRVTLVGERASYWNVVCRP